jgi:WD40 repeat protein
MLPPGATATVDGKDAAGQHTFEFSQFNSNRVQRVELAVKFSDATEAKRTVELEPGRHVRVPVNMPPVDQPTTVLTESPAPMLWADFSPDSRWLATASENHSVVLWDLAAGRAVRNFSGHQDAVQSVVFSRDGQLLLTSSTDTTAALWDVRSGKLIRKFKGHTAGVNSAVFSPDGKKILTGSSDNTAILWDARTDSRLRGTLQRSRRRRVQPGRTDHRHGLHRQICDALECRHGRKTFFNAHRRHRFRHRVQSRWQIGGRVQF